MTYEGPTLRVTAAGDTVVVALPETPSSGYRWQLDEDDTQARVLDVLYVDSSPSGPLPGGGGSRVFHLRVPGPCELVFLLRPPRGPKTKALERRLVSVVIEPGPTDVGKP